MALSLRFPVLLAGAVAAAIALAPAATADDSRPGSPDSRADSPSAAVADSKAGAAQKPPVRNPSAKSPAAKGPLSSDFSAGLPTGWTNEALWARPGVPSPFGKGPKPPVLALD